MRKLLALLLLIPCVANAQNLFTDFNISIYSGFNTSSTIFYFPGFVSYNTQVLFATTPNPSNNAALCTTYGSTLPSKKSAIWWNTGSANINGANGSLVAGQVTLQSIDLTPAIETTAEGTPSTPTPVTFRMAAHPVDGVSTPGKLVMMQCVYGTWSTVYTLDLSSSVSDTRTLDVHSHTRYRWLLERTGTAGAFATLSLDMQVGK